MVVRSGILQEEEMAKEREIAARLIPVTVVVAAATAIFVVFFAVFKVALGVVVVSHVVVFVFVEFVVFDFLDFVVFRIFLLGRFILGLVLGFVGVVEVCELVACGFCVDFKCLFARVWVVAFAFRVNYVPELFWKVLFF
jgi:hypothetical protein